MKSLEVKYQLCLDEDQKKDVLDEVFDRIFSKIWTTYSGEGETTVSGSSSVGAYTNSDNHLCPSTHLQSSRINSPSDPGTILIGSGDYDVSQPTYSKLTIAPWNLIINPLPYRR